jgi:prepilin-type N-terminal cleavage/methylation domain-containing protein
MSNAKREKGITLLELLVVLAVLGALSAVTVGAVNRIIDQASCRSLVQTFKALVGEASTRAVIEGRHIAIVFGDDGRGATAQLFADGDGDGVLRGDINRGIDKALGSAVYLNVERAYVGIPEGATVDPDGKALSSQDAIRFGRGNILSFGPLATATPGSLYLRDQDGKEGWAFRVAGIDGRVRVYRWFKGRWERWD